MRQKIYPKVLSFKNPNWSIIVFRRAPAESKEYQQLGKSEAFRAQSGSIVSVGYPEHDNISSGTSRRLSEVMSGLCCVH